MPFEWTPEFWQSWRESANPYRYFKSERDRALALQALQLRDGDRVLEVGCGYGWISQALLQAARIRWVGLDRSLAMVRHLRLALGVPALAAFVSDACLLPFPSDSFDKVLCTGVLMHIANDALALREIARVLRPGGRLVCSINNALSPFSIPVRLRNSLKHGFIQNFRLPGEFEHSLQALGFDIDSVSGDALLITVPLQIGRLSFPPRFVFPCLRPLDQWAVRQFPRFAYEIWFTGTKRECAPANSFA